MHHIDKVCSTRTKRHFYLFEKKGGGNQMTLTIMVIREKEFTPRPLKKRHMRLMNKPGGPLTNVFTKPKTRTDNGIRTANGTMDVLKRSSGYQAPPRFLRHLITVRSDSLPIINAPTTKKKRKKEEVSCQGQRYLFAKRVFTNV